MIRAALLVLLLAPVTATALNLKVGLMYADEPLYNGTYDGDEYNETPIVGRIELIQKFRIEKNVSINVFAVHMSQFMRSDPHYGINAVGAELDFDINLFD